MEILMEIFYKGFSIFSNIDEPRMIPVSSDFDEDLPQQEKYLQIYKKNIQNESSKCFPVEIMSLSRAKKNNFNYISVVC